MPVLRALRESALPAPHRILNLPRLRKMQKRDSAAEQQATVSLQSSGVAFSCCLSLLCDKSKANTSTGADLENFMTVAHRVWLVSRRGQTKEFCDYLLWGL